MPRAAARVGVARVAVRAVVAAAQAPVGWGAARAVVVRVAVAREAG